MGGYDNCCAICGVKVSQLIYEDDDDIDPNANEDVQNGSESHEDDEGYDKSLIKVEDVLWMNDVRIISENREALSMNKVFVSGPAEYGDWGFFDVEPGNHPNFPTQDQMEYDEEGQVNFRCYDWSTDHAFAIPFHPQCRGILRKFVSTQLNGEFLDDDIMYHTFKDFVNEGDDFSQCLTKIDYGIDTTEQYWEPRRGEEYVVMEPMQIFDLADYYADLPQRDDEDTEMNTHTHVSAVQLSNDPMARLAPELLFEILITLPMESVNCLRAASPAVARLELNNGFWKQKLLHDMPWLFDFPTDAEEYLDLDWAKCYADLRARSQNGNPAQILALVNRKRIWGVCEQFGPSYARRKAVKDEERRRSQGSLLTQATSTPIRRLTSPQAKIDSLALALLRSLSDLDQDPPILSVYWTKKGALSGFGVQRANMDTIGSPEKFAVRDEVKIQKNDWIRGFIVTSTEIGDSERRKVVGLKVLFIHGEPIQLGQSNGDHILIHTESDRLLAGLFAEWSPGNPISGLSLLHVPVSKGAPHAAELVRAQVGKPESSTAIGSRLWKESLPAPEMSPSEERLGYWSMGFKTDLAPMEALVFGRDEDELAAITEIAVDAQIGAFEVRYTNKPTKTIGPRPLTMKSLPIDGAGGERIVAVGAAVGHITHGIRFITNYNRQLILGSCRPNQPSETVYACTDEKALCGIYCNWSSRSSPQARLQCIAGLFAPSSSSEEEGPAGQQDTGPDGEEHWWEPCEPPTGWTAVGPLYGAHETPSSPIRPGTSFPSTTAVVTWLDCTRPVRKVRLNVAHRTQNLPFTPTSLILEYADGSTGSIGPTRLTAPTDTEGQNKYPWCWCHYDIKLPESESPLGKTLHYSTAEEWSIEGGAVLESCRLWVDNDGPLRGIQFVSADGRESPRWGVCDGEPVVIALGGHSGNNAVGLKVFLDSNHRPVTYPDTFVVGIQALVAS
ncbi:hypothetical protein ASPVEDRAFT_764138 [Aspergillus versicolor CBS 583.65]|uniref:F-box domain-containing protein n=1 Tax=Aspergillus versicolor CBS 583.65 TaxID=1036611 RepID=A0A1L9PR13_ASPVE|nr:uncharacterized protein ASPVEDRAFT_764138 [Aspergillus versicolor CBS 583.65]OJJ03998.1 hypothetical protein ASPVEDRAFT_764138 [Aspergillus versicolor CBS 583.65]